jgi:hypothetical protein
VARNTDLFRPILQISQGYIASHLIFRWIFLARNIALTRICVFRGF